MLEDGEFTIYVLQARVYEESQWYDFDDVYKVNGDWFNTDPTHFGCKPDYSIWFKTKLKGWSRSQDANKALKVAKQCSVYRRRMYPSSDKYQIVFYEYRLATVTVTKKTVPLA